MLADGIMSAIDIAHIKRDTKKARAVAPPSQKTKAPKLNPRPGQIQTASIEVSRNARLTVDGFSG